jgi:hypothetical protein
MANDYPGPFKFKNGVIEFCVRPLTGNYLPVCDARQEIKAKAEKCPQNALQALVFYQHRIGMIESARIPDDDKQRQLKSIRFALELLLDANPHLAARKGAPPFFSGTAYGTYYLHDKLKFRDSTALLYEVVSVANVGDANQLLYLATKNRAEYGAETAVSYIKQDDSRFFIVDWGVNHPNGPIWALCLPHTALGDYLTTRDVHGHHYQLISVVNSHRRLSTPEWANEVLLYNYKAQRYDLIYCSHFQVKPSDEKRYHFWGAIIEVSEPFPFPTKDIGFVNAYIMQDAHTSQLLTKDVTEIEPGSPPSNANLYLIENYTFIAHW